MSKDRDKENIVKETGTAQKYNKYTYSDYLSWPDDKRYELIDGVVHIMSAAPYSRHQEISGEIYRQFANYLIDKLCKVYSAPFDLRLPEREEDDEDISTVVQPDISVICDYDKIDKRGCKGAPDLIVEIVSPSSGSRDKKIKRDLYERHGVKEYWIVDYNDNTVEVYLLYKGQYSKPDIYTDEDMLPVSIFDDLEINLKMVFK